MFSAGAATGCAVTKLPLGVRTGAATTIRSRTNPSATNANSCAPPLPKPRAVFYEIAVLAGYAMRGPRR